MMQQATYKCVDFRRTCQTATSG